MAYDRADNDPAKDAVRVAFFVTWAMSNSLAGQLHLEDDQELLRHLLGSAQAVWTEWDSRCHLTVTCPAIPAAGSAAGRGTERRRELYAALRQGYDALMAGRPLKRNNAGVRKVPGTKIASGFERM